MCVPGAMRSGFFRPSEVGPRLLNEMMSFALSAPVLPIPQPSVPVCRKFSDARAVMTFFAVPGAETVFGPDPAFPAANTTAISWLPVVPAPAARPRTSYAGELVAYAFAPVPVSPQELLLTRAPLLYAFAISVEYAVEVNAPALLKIFDPPTRANGAIPSPYW